MRFVLAVLVWGMGAVVAVAQGIAPPGAVLAELRANPARFVAEAAEVIAGHGTPSGISAAGIELVIALEAAEGRADALRRVLAADVDDDGVVSLAEVEARAAALGARARGQLRLAFRGADKNADGVADAAELRAQARQHAARLAGRRPEMLRGLMAFDGNRDGHLTLEELAQGVEATLAAPDVAAQPI